MAILKTCCCWRTVRRGSYASALYTMTYFAITGLLMSQFLHEERMYLASENENTHVPSLLEPDTISHTTMSFSVAVLVCSVCGVATSILLLIGLYWDNKFLLIPWILTVTVATGVDLAHCLYIFVEETLKFNPLTAILFTIDFFLLSLNVYSLLCVVSQYQEYRVGRGTAEYDREIMIPNVQYTAATTTGTSCVSGGRRVTICQDAKLTPTQSPTVLNFSPGIDSEPNLTISGRRPSRKHVQFPIETAMERRPSSIEHDDLWTIDLRREALLAPD